MSTGVPVGDAQPHRHEIRVRYGEVDMQGVVFNAHYFAYCDDAVDSWLRTLSGRFEELGWDLMLKKATVTWHGSAGIGDVLALDVSLARWGSTSFDIGIDGHVGERPVFSASITYVGVRAGTTETMPPPPAIRALLGDAP